MLIFEPIFDFRAERKRSRAELSRKSFSSSYGSSQLGSDSSLVSSSHNWAKVLKVLIYQRIKLYKISRQIFGAYNFEFNLIKDLTTLLCSNSLGTYR